MTDHLAPGPFTRLDPAHARFADALPPDPVAVCTAVQGLVIQPHDAVAAGVPGHRIAEKDLRPAAALLDVLTGLDASPLAEPRPPAARVVGTCRHFTVLACALLRHHGIPARARCGFGTYFQAGLSFDHWVTEYRDGGRWVRIDTEHLGHGFTPDPADLSPGEFLTGGEAWVRYRAGADPATFGVPGTDHAWGVGEIRGNAIRDLAALRDREMLPWDEWGRMTDSYDGKTGPDYDELMDRIAEACAAGDPAAVAELYAVEDLAVPEHLVA